MNLVIKIMSYIRDLELRVRREVSQCVEKSACRYGHFRSMQQRNRIAGKP